MENNTILESRIVEATKYIPFKEELQARDYPSRQVIDKALKLIGIDDSDEGQKILESNVTKYDHFYSALKEFENDLNLYAVPKLKIMWSILKGNDPFEKKDGTKDSSLYSKPVSKRIEEWQDLELLEAYNRDCPYIIEEELIKRAKGRYCIVFEDSGQVDVENSLYMLRRARRQETKPTHRFRDQIKQLYRVSEWPNDVFFECPIHNDMLLVDGYCDECGTTWDQKDYDKNVFLRLINEEEDVDMRIYRGMKFDELKNNFPRVFMKYTDLKAEGKLPSMKKKPSASKKDDPWRLTSTRVTY